MSLGPPYPKAITNFVKLPILPSLASSREVQVNLELTVLVLWNFTFVLPSPPHFFFCFFLPFLSSLSSSSSSSPSSSSFFSITSATYKNLARRGAPIHAIITPKLCAPSNDNEQDNDNAKDDDGNDDKGGHH